MKFAKRGMTITSLLMATSMLLAACGADPTATPPAAPTATTGAAAGATATTATTGGPTATTAAAKPTLPPTIAVAPFAGDTIKIAVDLPTSGADASDGVPTRNGVELAIDQANAKGGVTIGGKTYKLAMYALDDAVNGTHNPDQGVKNVQQFIADPAVMAQVGPFNSNVARAEMPILNVAGLVNISPSNTAEGLTKPEYGETGTYRPTGNVTYFRVCTTDDIQGPTAADYMYDTLKAKKIYILDDTETYGKGLADNVEKEFTKKGGTVVGHEGVPKGTQDYSTILTKIQSLSPDAVFYGGTTSNGLALARKQMIDLGFDVPFMGGDGIKEAEFVKVAGDAGKNSYATVAAVNAATLPEAADFLTAYKAKYGEDVGAYSANGYEAANIIIAALGKATSVDRPSVLKAVAATKDFKGVLGTTSFDANGDTTNKWISIYEVKDKADGTGVDWSYIDQIQFK
ncbi:MAG TPA: branched-chain amino acid ABC transporter substrate-binding protein [Chloroflexia bacterium]|nr:branched-chain amino acid ABC transporter substrate-binding protein [Chloroflexia bacterium]